MKKFLFIAILCVISVPFVMAELTADQLLLKAVIVGDVKELDKAIKAGANVNAKDEKGNVALRLAAKSGGVGVVKLLMSNPNITIRLASKDHVTPFEEAVFYGKKDIIKLFIEGVDQIDKNGQKVGVSMITPNERFRKDGKNALHMIVIYKQPEILEMLIDRFLMAMTSRTNVEDYNADKEANDYYNALKIFNSFGLNDVAEADKLTPLQMAEKLLKKTQNSKEQEKYKAMIKLLKNAEEKEEMMYSDFTAFSQEEK
ncbi:MAG: ankyrin repeat domain-containing protein [Candidatus Dependentiae bacterium]|nr:ankyrin repeat domain-containing protein [Candidatus Dependentiae bacterium]